MLLASWQEGEFMNKWIKKGSKQAYRPKKGIGAKWKLQAMVYVFIYWHLKIIIIIPNYGEWIIWMLINFNFSLIQFWTLILVKDFWNWPTTTLDNVHLVNGPLSFLIQTCWKYIHVIKNYKSHLKSTFF